MCFIYPLWQLTFELPRAIYMLTIYKIQVLNNAIIKIIYFNSTTQCTERWCFTILSFRCVSFSWGHLYHLTISAIWTNSNPAVSQWKLFFLSVLNKRYLPSLAIQATYHWLADGCWENVCFLSPNCLPKYLECLQASKAFPQSCSIRYFKWNLMWWRKLNSGGQNMICSHSQCVFMFLAKRESGQSLKSSLEESHKLCPKIRALSAKRLLQFISVTRLKMV